MRYLIPAILIVCLMAAPLEAAPSISGITGTVGDNAEIVISGTDFGTNALTIEWLGGNGGVIESGTDGNTFISDARAGWDEIVNPCRYDDDFAYSYDKSLIFDSTYDDTGAFGLSYDTGGTITTGYTTYYTYFDNNENTVGQWKMLRCMPVDDSVADEDTPQWIMFNKWQFGGTSNIAWRRIEIDDEMDETQTSNLTLPGVLGWYRVEVLLTPSSDGGEADASGEVWIHNPGTSITSAWSDTGIVSYIEDEALRYRYWVYQNYMGNGFGGTSGTKVWMDDIYISNTPARVEIGNASTWAGCTQRDIQKPSAWSTTSITFNVNMGNYNGGETAYLYVVDSDNVANANGYEITLGSASCVCCTCGTE